MKTDKIYLVITSELLSDDQWHDEICRAFKHKKDADTFMQRLVQLYRQDKHISNPTRFWVQSCPYSSTAFLPEGELVS
jgi:hypothetical protein